MHVLIHSLRNYKSEKIDMYHCFIHHNYLQKFAHNDENCTTYLYKKAVLFFFHIFNLKKNGLIQLKSHI